VRFPGATRPRAALPTIQPIFDNRCVSCHSCFNAPCQLNLQSYSGLARGATKLKVYDGSRPKSVAPTRLDIDGHTIADWQQKGSSTSLVTAIRLAHC
jgi:hypothetical protein